MPSANSQHLPVAQPPAGGGAAIPKTARVPSGDAAQAPMEPQFPGYPGVIPGAAAPQPDIRTPYPGAETRRATPKAKKPHHQTLRQKLDRKRETEAALDALFGAGEMDATSALRVLGYRDLALTGHPKRTIRKRLRAGMLELAHPGKPDWLYRIDRPLMGWGHLRKFQKDLCGICGKHHIEVGGLRVDYATDDPYTPALTRGLLCPTCWRNVDHPRPGRSRKWHERRRAYLDAPPAQVQFGLSLQNTRAASLSQMATMPEVEGFSLSRAQARALYDLCTIHSSGWVHDPRACSTKKNLTMQRLCDLRLATHDVAPFGGRVIATEAGKLLARFLGEIASCPNTTSSAKSPRP